MLRGSRQLVSDLSVIWHCELFDTRPARYRRLCLTGILRDRHGHPRRLQREDRREDVGVFGDFPVQLATARFFSRGS